MARNSPQSRLTLALEEKLEEKTRLSFLPNVELKKILNRGAIEELFDGKLPRLHRERRRTIINEIFNSRLRTLAAILFMHESEALGAFFKWCKSGQSELRDDGLPYAESTVRQYLSDFAPRFCREQLKVCAAVYKEKENHEESEQYYIDHREPIICMKELGRGYSGTVFDVQIAPGHLKDENGRINSQAVRLARKVFGSDYRRASATAEDHGRENKICQRLSDAPWMHKGLLYKRFSVVTRNTENRIVSCSLFYDLATCNLKEAFEGQQTDTAPPPWRTLNDRYRIIDQLCNIAQAMGFVHHANIIHQDLKPENILVFREGTSYELKIADYGLATEVRDLGENMSVTGSAEIGEFQAPEVRSRRNRVGWWSDDWSLACIILWVLAYMDEGTKGVKALKDAKETNRKDRTYDTFFESKTAQNGSVELVAGVKEYCRKLVDSFRTRDQKEGDTIEKLIKSLKDEVLQSSEKRRKLPHDYLFQKLNNAKATYASLVEAQVENEKRQQTEHFHPPPDTSQPLVTTCTPLCKAARVWTKSGAQGSKNLTEEIEKLLQRGDSPTDICHFQSHQTSPIYHAIWKTDEVLLRLLLDKGKNIDLLKPSPVHQRPPLAVAGSSGKVRLCKILVEYMKNNGMPIRQTDFLPRDRHTDNYQQIAALIQKYEKL